MLTERLQKVPTLPPALPTTGRCADDSRAPPPRLSATGHGAPVGDAGHTPWPSRQSCCFLASPQHPLTTSYKNGGDVKGKSVKNKNKKKKGQQRKNIDTVVGSEICIRHTWTYGTDSWSWGRWHCPCWRPRRAASAAARRPLNAVSEDGGFDVKDDAVPEEGEPAKKASRSRISRGHFVTLKAHGAKR